MEGRRVTRGRKVKYVTDDFGNDDSGGSNYDANLDGDTQEQDEDDRKSRIRDTNKEFAKRMAILQTWSEYWIDYTTREGEAYSKEDAKNILKKSKKISCPIENCKKSFTTMGGLRYHYARCNIERCFKCKVCSPHAGMKTRGDLLRHMVRAHYDRLPALEGEQEEIAQGFLSTDTKYNRRSTFADSEHGMAQPRFYIKSFAELAARTSVPDDNQEVPFKDWCASVRDWEFLITEIDRRKFFPPEQSSVRFKSSKMSTYMTLNIGESAFLRTESDQLNSLVFFTGGINTSAAWMPKQCDVKQDANVETLAVAVNGCSMDRSVTYKDMKDINGCIQFWTATLSSSRSNATTRSIQKPQLELMIGHNFGLISAMCWCPMGTSWESESESYRDGILPRLGLLALACGDAQIRIISVPHLDCLLKMTTITKRFEDSRAKIPMFRVKQIATLMPPGIGISTDCQPISCTSIAWNVQDHQRLIVAGYSNGDVALFDLDNSSPILYCTVDNRHIYQSYKKWQAHLLPVLGIGIMSNDVERTFLASGGRDRILRLWDSCDMESSLVYERAPITNLRWDFRLKGVVTTCEAAFTSFVNRVSYRYPSTDGFNSASVSTHRATVCGLDNSIITSSLATSDEAGEVLVQPTGRPNQKRAKTILDTMSLFTLVPRSSEGIIHSHGTDTPSTSAMANTSTNEMIEQINENTDPNNVDLDEANEIQITDDYTFAERGVANKPDKILLPLEERAIDTFADFKNNYVLEFIEYDSKLSRASNKLPEAWTRAANAANIYCDRVCDYPFSSIKHVTWSPNLNSFSYLLSSTHVGLCRLDRVSVLETIYNAHIDAAFGAVGKERNPRR